LYDTARLSPTPAEFLETLFSLSGKVAVVIGGTGELCGAMAEGLASAGVEVVIVGRNQQKAAARLANIDAAGGKGWFHAAEATSRAELERLLGAVLGRCGRIDIVVNGAGVNSATPFLEIEEEEFDRIIRVNLKAVFFGCQVFGKHLVAAGHGGSIINIGSMSGVIPLSRVFTYSATKSAVHNLSMNLAREWAPQRVRVNVLVPGFFPAEQNRRILQPERVAKIMSHTPMARFGEARELIAATLLLASDTAGSFITGEELIVDGGFHAMAI
jgi:NAD(P)-dependent dehydrogenase (short-subunit alcohol dehydrogenase family)